MRPILVLLGLSFLGVLVFYALKPAANKAETAPTSSTPAGKASVTLSVGLSLPLSLTVSTTQTNTPTPLKALLNNKPAVLVFYPADQTPGCTLQLCSLRDAYSTLQEQNVQVFGVNKASKQSHLAFAKKQNYPFPLIVDDKNQLAKALGIGETFGFVSRTVVIVNQEGNVAWFQSGMPSVATIIKNLPQE